MIVDLKPLLVLVVGLVGSWFLVRLLAKRGIDASGLEAAVLGILAGPHIEGLVTTTTLTAFSPMISFALGLLGFRVGLRLKTSFFRNRPTDTLRITLIIAAITALFVGIAVFGLLYWNFDRGNLGAATGILIAAALLSSPTVVQELIQRDRSTGETTEIVQHVAVLSEVLGILVLGIVFAIYHHGPSAIAGSRPLVAVEWLALAITAGVVIGLLFSWFLGTIGQAENPMMVTTLGMLLFAAGICMAFGLSPILVCMVVGVVVANTSAVNESIEEPCRKIWKPVLALLIFAVACAWHPPPYIAWALIPAFLIVRLAGRWVGGMAAKVACNDERDRATDRIGLSLIGQGGIAVAIALNAWQVYNDAISSTVVTCLLVVGLLNELPSVWVVRNTLVDAGDYPVDSMEDSA